MVTGDVELVDVLAHRGLTLFATYEVQGSQGLSFLLIWIHRRVRAVQIDHPAVALRAVP